MDTKDFVAQYPLIWEVLRNFARGNDAAYESKPAQFAHSYIPVVIGSQIDLAAAELEAGRMDELQRDVIVRGVLPAEAGWITYDEETLTRDFPLVGAIANLIWEASGGFSDEDEGADLLPDPMEDDQFDMDAYYADVEKKV